MAGSGTTRIGAVMVLARRSDPAEFAAWCERTEVLTLEQARRHPLAIVRRAAEEVHRLEAPAVPALVEQLRRDLRRHADWQEDDSRFFYAVMRAAPEQRYVAACELAARPRFIPSRFANPRVEACLRHEAALRGGRGAVRQWLMSVLAPEAIITVAKQFDRPRKIRLGRDWLADERDRVVRIRPGELSPQHARRYVRQAVRTTLEWLILREGTSGSKQFSLDRALEGTMDNPERLLLDREDAAGDLGATMDATSAPRQDILSTLDAKGITPRERKLLAYRLQHRSSAEIAALLDMPSAGAVRRALVRVRKKLAG